MQHDDTSTACQTEIDRLLDTTLSFFDKVDPEKFYSVDTAAAMEQLHSLISFGFFDDDRIILVQQTLLKKASNPKALGDS